MRPGAPRGATPRSEHCLRVEISPLAFCCVQVARPKNRYGTQGLRRPAHIHFRGTHCLRLLPLELRTNVPKVPGYLIGSHRRRVGGIAHTLIPRTDTTWYQYVAHPCNTSW